MIDYYVRTTADLLLNAQLSRTTGFPSILANIGSMENKGWEFTVRAIPLKTKDLTWSINANIAFNTNKITALYNDAEYVDGRFIRRVGADFQTYYGRAWAGVDPANGNALWYTDDTREKTTSTYSAQVE